MRNRQRISRKAGLPTVVKPLSSKRLGERLRELIRPTEPGRVTEISMKSGVSASYIYRLMKGDMQNPSSIALDAIAKACETNIANLFAPWQNPEQDENLARKENERAHQLLDIALAKKNWRQSVLTILE